MNIIFAASTLSLALGARIADLVPSLPDQPPLSSHWYSGLLNANDTRQFHYVYVDSYSSPSTDPVLLWLDGGPGITSLVGLFNLGPLTLRPQVPFTQNPYTWAQRANLLFISNPAGVGFSYAAREEDMHNNDMSDARDLHRVVCGFYEGWPELRGSPLYVGGSSYGGGYAPHLAWEIH
jgi:cathepsin A (carboxypeptidase C)